MHHNQVKAIRIQRLSITIDHIKVAGTSDNAPYRFPLPTPNGKKIILGCLALKPEQVHGSRLRYYLEDLWTVLIKEKDATRK